MVNLIRKLTKKYGTDKTNEIIEELMLVTRDYDGLCEGLEYVIDTGRVDFNPSKTDSY